MKLYACRHVQLLALVLSVKLVLVGCVSTRGCTSCGANNYLQSYFLILKRSSIVARSKTLSIVEFVVGTQSGLGCPDFNLV